LNLIFTPFAVRVGNQEYPIAAWTDFAGVALFRWYRAVLNLSNDKCRAARLPFWQTYEMWLRRTKGYWWRLSLVERKPKAQTILYETLVIPEVVEAALLTATHKLLAGAKSVGVWTDDCVALDALLGGRESYLEDMEAGRIPAPSFLSGRVPVRLQRGEPMWGLASAPPAPSNGIHRLPLADRDLPLPIRRRMLSLPLLCPRCGGILRPWKPDQTNQFCPLCKHDVRLG
jgi:hypothetical protein